MDEWVFFEGAIVFKFVVLEENIVHRPQESERFVIIKSSRWYMPTKFIFFVILLKPADNSI